jgi:hypothetical protein
MLRLLFEGFRQGSKAFVQEAILLSNVTWGFRFEDVDYDPIRIWHGSNDVNAPIEAIRYMNQRLPHSILTEFAGDTHFTMAKHFSQALDELVPQQELKSIS